MEKKFINVEEYVDNISGDTIKVISKQAVSINFDEIFSTEDDILNNFIIKPKQAFYNNRNLIFPYINYFIEYYDTDNELLMAYYHLKFMIDRKNNYSKELFIDELYEYILSDTMVEKINRMVEDNYTGSLKAKKEHKHKSIQFTNEHGKIILASSLGIKMMVPLVTHYLAKSNITNTDLFLLEVFVNIFSYFEGEYNMKNKIYELVLSKVNTTQSKDRGHWNNVEIDGEDIESETTNIYNSMIVNILYKTRFQGNIAAYLSASIRQNMGWMVKRKFGKNHRAITGQKDSDGLSDLDKIEMNMSKMDESYIILGEINIDHVIKKLRKKFKVDYEDDEVHYYMENMKLNKLQKELIFQILGRYFGCIRDIYNSVDEIKIAELIIIIKHIFALKGFKIMQHILTGKMDYNPNLRKLPKSKLNDMMNSDKYFYIKKKYKYTCNLVLETEVFREILNKLLNSDVEIVDYSLRNSGKKYIDIQGFDNLIMAEYMDLIEKVI